MNRRSTVIAALVKKDVLLLWPLAALAATLRLLQVVYVDVGNMSQDGMGILATLHQVAIFASVGLFVVAAIQNDAIASVRHDWLTRPIAGSDLIFAKAICIVALIAIPTVVIDTLIYSVRFDFSLGESLARATTAREMFLMVVISAVIATLTATILQALGAAIGTIAVAVLVFLPAMQLSSMREDYFASGAQWILALAALVAIIAVSILLLWLQYTRRATRVSRSIFAATVVVLSAAPLGFSWNAIFAMQKSLSTEQAAAEQVQLALADGCFRTGRVDAPLEAAGPDAIELVTEAMPSGIPDGWRLHVGRVQAHYIDQEGRNDAEPVPARMMAQRTDPNGTGAVQHLWLLSRSNVARMSADPSTHLRIEYSLGLLKREAVIDVPVDGIRRHSPELGYCGAEWDARDSIVKVGCFKRGRTPALVTGQVGESTSITPVAFVDYTPGWLELLASRQYNARLRHSGPAPSRVTLVTYEDRAHFNRVIDVPGMLGGPVSQCPAPAAH
jgi:hypothetical protein